MSVTVSPEITFRSPLDLNVPVPPAVASAPTTVDVYRWLGSGQPYLVQVDTQGSALLVIWLHPSVIPEQPNEQKIRSPAVSLSGKESKSQFTPLG